MTCWLEYPIEIIAACRPFNVVVKRACTIWACVLCRFIYWSECDSSVKRMIHTADVCHIATQRKFNVISADLDLIYALHHVMTRCVAIHRNYCGSDELALQSIISDRQSAVNFGRNSDYTCE